MPVPDETIAERLHGLLEPGESVQVTCAEDGSLEIEETSAGTSKLRTQHPELHGLLLTINQRIDDAGGCLLFLGILGAALGLLYAATHGILFEAEPGSDLQEFLDTINSWWGYAGAGAVAFGIWSKVDDGMERSAYRAKREEIRAEIATRRLDAYTLISMAEDDGGLSSVLKYMQRDDELLSS